ncbi:MAG: hypothetical protein AB7E72_20950, partial [Lysobacterales bacterium]
MPRFTARLEQGPEAKEEQEGREVWTHKSLLRGAEVDAMRAVDARSSAVPKPQGATLMSTTLAANATTFNITLPVLC